jgi:arylsulfatase
MPNAPMNVVFLMADQQRADSFGPGRHPCADYPVMERLAGESVTFGSMYVAASPCVPSRASFLTGRQPWILGRSSNAKFLMGDQTTWMSILRDRGYACVSVGKTHMVHAGSYHIQVPVGRTFGDQGDWDHFHPSASPASDEDYFDIRATRRACEALERLKDAQPFALFLGFHAPHEPYVMPRRYLDFVDPADVPLPRARRADEYRGKSAFYRERVDHFRTMFGEIDDEATRRGIAGHHCLLKLVDDCLGQVLETLRKLGLLGHTLMVYTADHGDLLGEHSLFNKAATFYESEVRVPFMLRFPDGRGAGTRLSHLASSIDFVPTLLEILGIRAEVSLPGLSLVPAIDRGMGLRDAVTCATVRGMMVRTEASKLWYDHRSRDGEMYDLAADPDELENLYDVPERAELRRTLFERMLHARMEDDSRDALPTEREKRLHREVWSSYEPEVVAR